MADLGDLRVKIGADLTELLSKVDAAKAKLNQLTETNQQLKTGLADLNSSLRLNESALAKTGTALKKLIESGKGATVEARNLRKETSVLSANSLDLNKAIAAGKTDLANNTAQIKLQTVALKAAEAGTTGFAKGATKLFSGLRTLANIIPGIGIGGLVALIAGPVIDAFSAWFDTINKVNGSVKLLKENQANLNEVLSEANKDAGKQTADLKILYDAATDVNLSMKDRLAAVKGLQAEFPDFFGNIKKETILNGGAKAAYDALTQSIIAQARAKAVLSKIEELAARQLDIDINKQKVLAITSREIAQAQAKIGNASQISAGLGVTAASQGLTKTQVQEIIKNRRDLRLGVLEENSKFIKGQIDFLTKFAGLPNLAKVIEADIKAPKIKDVKATTKDVESIADVLEKLRIQIDFLNQKEITLKVNQYGAKISEIEKTIEHLLQKFKLTGESEVIINLKAKIVDIQLTEEFKKVFNPKGPIKVPLDIQFEMLKKVDPFPPGAFDEKVLSDQIRAKLDKLKIKIDINGFFITTGTSLPALQKTLDSALQQLQSFQDDVVNLSVSIADSFGAGLANLAKGGSGLGSIFQGLLGTLGEFLIKMGEGAVKASALSLALKKIAASPQLSLIAGLAAIVAGNLIKSFKIPGFAEGGHVKGSGAKTSDSIIIRVSPGEYVIKSDTVSKLGVPFFDRLNKGAKPVNYAEFMKGTHSFPKFATGGFISPNIVSVNQSPVLSGINIGSGQRIEVVGEFLMRGNTAVALVKRGNAQISRNG